MTHRINKPVVIGREGLAYYPVRGTGLRTQPRDGPAWWEVSWRWRQEVSFVLLQPGHAWLLWGDFVWLCDRFAHRDDLGGTRANSPGPPFARRLAVACGSKASVGDRRSPLHLTIRSDIAGVAMRAETIGVLAGPTARRRRRSGLNPRMLVEGLLRLGDLAVVGVAGAVASALRFAGTEQPDVATAALLIGLLAAANVFAWLKIYDVERFTQLSHQLPRLFAGWAVTIGGVLAVLYGMKSAGDLSRLWVGYWFVAGAAGFVLWRVLVKHVILGAQARGQLRRNLVLVGEGHLMADCLGRMGSPMAPPFSVCAALVTDGAPVPLPPGCRSIGDLAELESVAREVEADQVILAVPLGRTEEILSLVRRLKNLPIELSLYPDAVGAGLPLAGLPRLGDAPLIQLMQRPLDGWRYVLKSVEDRALAALLLVASSPLLALIAVTIRLTSPGPVLYRQLRHGFNGELISVVKFRTMYADACDAADASEVRQATLDDLRVTPVGRLLRRASLDELPQLLNVLRGEMSLVGPRPHAVAHDYYYSQLIDGYLARHRVKPGITGWAQVNGYRGETKTIDEMRKRIELDLDYIEKISIPFDLRIMLKTIVNVLFSRNAY